MDFMLKKLPLSIIENKLDSGKNYIIVIDGFSGSGKSTFSIFLNQYFQSKKLFSQIIHLDDFIKIKKM